MPDAGSTVSRVGHHVLHDDRVAGHVVDVELLVVLEVRVERHPEQTRLRRGADRRARVGHVHQRSRLHLAVLDDPDLAALLHHIQTCRITRGLVQVHRTPGLSDLRQGDGGRSGPGTGVARTLVGLRGAAALFELKAGGRTGVLVHPIRGFVHTRFAHAGLTHTRFAHAGFAHARLTHARFSRSASRRCLGRRPAGRRAPSRRASRGCPAGRRAAGRRTGGCALGAANGVARGPRPLGLPRGVRALRRRLGRINRIRGTVTSSTSPHSRQPKERRAQTPPPNHSNHLFCCSQHGWHPAIRLAHRPTITQQARGSSGPL